MGFKVTLQPSGSQFEQDADESILAGAARAGIELPYGCRNGACGSCRGRIVDGQVDHGAAQLSTLSEADRAAGYALLCCAKPLGDVCVEARVLDSNEIRPRIMPVRVQKLEPLAGDVMRLELKLPATEKFNFRAGQYIDFLLKEGKRRSFSMANAPHEGDHIELHVRHVPGGYFTEHVFKEMKEKTILRIEAPLGSFYLREDSDKPIILMATGTGFGPIKGILSHAFATQTTRPITLYWGGRTLGDLYLAELARQWEAEHANFTFVPVLSRPEPGWTGRSGHITSSAIADFPDLTGHQVYVCGNPAMVADTRRLFLAAGLPEEELYSDAFTFAKDPQKA